MPATGTGDVSAYFITTAIPYVNARPHIGFALEIVQTDTFARYHRQRGEDVYFLTGSDENSLKNVQAAEAEGITHARAGGPQRRGLRGPARRCSTSRSTTSSAPAPTRATPAGAQKLWEACAASGDIYQQDLPRPLLRRLRAVLHARRTDAGRPLPGAPDPARGGRGGELLLPPLALRPGSCCDLIESGELRIIPESRRNEVLSFIRMGLEDFSISRSLARARGWGVPVPGDPGQVMYVWFDALANYITALDYATRRPALPALLGRRARSGSTPSARASSASTPSTGRRCCSRPGVPPPSDGLRPRLHQRRRAEDEQVARQRGRRRTIWWRSTAPTPCATTCCARSRRPPTPTSPTRSSRAATTATWPTTWATCSTARSA